MKVKPAIIVYGNCQAEALAAILSNDPIASDGFDVLYIPSFDHPTRRANLSSQDSHRCVLLLEQHDPQRFPHHESLGPACTIVTFPATDFNLLWPFNCVNPFDRPEPEMFPYGRFPYGDRIVAECIVRGLTEQETVEYYFTKWPEFGPPLDRLYELELARLQARDKRCDISIGDFILEQFSEKRLFWAINHPASNLLQELLDRILQKAADADRAFSRFAVKETLAYRFNAEGPLGVVSVPIHPHVVEHFGLRWYDPNGTHQSYGGAVYSSETYIRQLIRWSVHCKNLMG